MNENESATTTFPTTKAAQTSETTPQAATIAAITCVGCNSSTRSVWPFFFAFIIEVCRYIERGGLVIIGN